MNLIKVFVISALVLSSSGVVFSQNMRGENASLPNPDHAEVARQIEMELLVDEIEDAGFDLDVEEGFDEEWEEDIWIASDVEDIESVVFDIEDSEILDAISEVESTVLEIEEELWTEADVDPLEPDAIYELDDFNMDERSEEPEIYAWGGDEETMEYESLLDEVGIEESWDDEIVDPGWAEVLEAWELEDLDFETEDEDLDLMEAIFYGS